MKVLIISDIASEHTEKWAVGLASYGIEVGLFSLNKASYEWYRDKPNITLLHQADKSIKEMSKLGKISYLKYLRLLNQAIKTFKPDVLHAHYATSNGFIGALTGFHPLVISAWGTDVMKFPQKNLFNKSVLKFNLKRADLICATSHTIQSYLKPVTDKTVKVIPFGVDTKVFCRKNVKRVFSDDAFVIGSVKGLESIYNIDVLIKAFRLLKTKYTSAKLKLLIVGVGKEEANLKSLVTESGLSEDVVFTGRVPFSQVSDYFNMIDVLVNISEYESFGVSVIEAMACEKAVVVTDTGGLKEIVENDKYGTLVGIRDIQQTAAAIEKYYLHPDLMKQTGIDARKKVMERYNLENNVKEMINAYHQLLNNKPKE